MRGLVRDAVTGKPVEAGVTCLSRSHECIATAMIGPRGSFELVARGLPAGTYQAAVFVDHATSRRLMHLTADTDEDLGTVAVRPAEYPPGVRGRLWDELGDHPITAGRVRLRQGRRLIGDVAVERDGSFEVEMTCDRPMPPGHYLVEAETAGYERRDLPVRIVAEVTVYQLGRVELVPENRDAYR